MTKRYHRYGGPKVITDLQQRIRKRLLTRGTFTAVFSLGDGYFNDEEIYDIQKVRTEDLVGVYTRQVSVKQLKEDLDASASIR